MFILLEACRNVKFDIVVKKLKKIKNCNYTAKECRQVEVIGLVVNEAVQGVRAGGKSDGWEKIGRSLRRRREAPSNSRREARRDKTNRREG